MSANKRGLLVLTVLLLLVGMHITQMIADGPYLEKIHRDKLHNQSGELMVQLPGQFMVGCFAGFKEVIASTLWIRADNFFHQGNFAAIVPIVRLVTWLDPHNIDVFTTGAWHLDYNFVDDKNQMSDKRYIPSSIALLREGIRANPYIYDLYFELAWTHYNRKMHDYGMAAKMMELACKYPGVDPNTGEATPRPQFVDRMLAHMYEEMGDLNKAIAQWNICRERTIKTMKTDPQQADRQDLILCDRNLMMLYLRAAWRYGDMDKYRKGLEIAKRWTEGRSPGVLPWAYQGALKDYQQRVATHNPPGDALKPLDAGFEATWKRISPKVFMISGNVNLLPMEEYKNLASECFTHTYQDNLKASANRRVKAQDGSRVYWRLEDIDYKTPDLDTFDWKIDTSKTVIWDDIHVAGGHFSALMDLSDPKFADMFPFKGSKYRLTIWVRPEEPGCPDYVQDRIGWRGEALTDKHYLDLKSEPGFHLLKKEILLDRKDIL